jgi:hypothetical protein
MNREDCKQAYRGITQVPKGYKILWKAQISCRGIPYFLGYFNSAEEAARAWDNAVYYLAARGYRAKDQLNFPAEWVDSCVPMTDKTAEIIAECEARKLTALAPKRDLKGGEVLLSALDGLVISTRSIIGQCQAQLSQFESLRKSLTGEEGEKEKQRRYLIEYLGKLPADSPLRADTQKMLDGLDKQN